MTRPKNTYAEVDTAALPIVVVLVVGPITDESFPAYLQDLLEAVQLGDRVAVRMHSGPLTVFPPRFARMSAAWLRENEALLKRHVVAVSIVMESAVLRMATQAIVWAKAPPFPMVAAHSKEEANAWLLERLAEDAP